MAEVIPLNGETWLICGGREFADTDLFDQAMANLLRTLGCPTVIVHGGATGADLMGADFGYRMGLVVIGEPALWSLHGVHQAGPIRNQKMLDDHKPDKVIAFPGGTGTADMVARARQAHVPHIVEIKR